MSAGDPKTPLVNQIVLRSITLSGPMPNAARYRDYLYRVPIGVLESRLVELQGEQQEFPALRPHRIHQIRERICA